MNRLWIPYTKTMVRLRIRTVESEGRYVAHKVEHSLWTLSALFLRRKQYIGKDEENNYRYGISNISKKRYWQYLVAKDYIGNDICQELTTNPSS